MTARRMRTNRYTLSLKHPRPVYMYLLVDHMIYMHPVLRLCGVCVCAKFKDTWNNERTNNCSGSERSNITETQKNEIQLKCFHR